MKTSSLAKNTGSKEEKNLTEIERRSRTKDKIFFLFIIPLFLYTSGAIAPCERLHAFVGREVAISL